MKPIFLNIQDTLLEYTKLKHPGKIILAINEDPDVFDILDKLKIKFSQNDYIINYDVVMILFDDEKEAINICDSIKERNPYCFVIKNGEIIHDNNF